jgi:hypothetical protein
MNSEIKKYMEESGPGLISDSVPEFAGRIFLTRQIRLRGYGPKGKPYQTPVLA